MATRSKWQHLATEAVNPRSRDIDTLTPDEIVEVMILDNRHVLAAVQREKTRIARGAELVADAVLKGGRLIFAGAGTSGRLGVLEAAELPPDVRHRPGHGAGDHGRRRRPRCIERKRGSKTITSEGERAMRGLRPTRKDVVIGISASGITPFVRGAVARARAAKARIIGVTCDPRSELKDLADVAIVLGVGPEVIAGSTRLKAGTATKIVLNMLTTAAMVRAGKTYGNLMVDVKSNSDKLRDRARRIIGSRHGSRLRRCRRAAAAGAVEREGRHPHAADRRDARESAVTAARRTQTAEASRPQVNPESLRRSGAAAGPTPAGRSRCAPRTSSRRRALSRARSQSARSPAHRASCQFPSSALRAEPDRAVRRRATRSRGGSRARAASCGCARASARAAR